MTVELQLLAAGDAVGAIIVVLIMIASGVINFIKERAAEARRKRELEESSGSLANDQLRGEIDQFLQEVERANRGTPSRNNEPAYELSDADVIDERPARKRAQNRPAPSAAPAEEKRQSVSQRHLKDSKLGQVGNRQVSSQVREHHLQSQVESKHLHPEADLGMRDTAAASGSVASEAPHPLIALLSSPDGVRNAVLLNEVLGPPLCRRKAR